MVSQKGQLRAAFFMSGKKGDNLSCDCMDAYSDAEARKIIDLAGF